MSNKYQWLWKSNANPWETNEEEEEWTTYSDIKMTIIEEAFQANLPIVDIDEYIIDLKRLLQIHKIDTTKQRPIKRISDRNLQCLREERFSLPSHDCVNATKSFKNEGQYMTPKFIEEWCEKSFDLTLTERAERAADGIRYEAHLLGQDCEGEWLAKQILDVKNQSWEEISLRCLYLYTRECFLYKLLNQILREEDLSKVDTLGPFCDFLWNSFSSDELKKQYSYKGIVYRGATLEMEQIEDYKRSLHKFPKEWLGFSSTSKNRQLAELYGNTLIIINIPSQSQHLDISTVSNFPEEQEVLLGASSCFQTEKVLFDEQTNKYHIHLRIVW